MSFFTMVGALVTSGALLAGAAKLLQWLGILQCPRCGQGRDGR